MKLLELLSTDSIGYAFIDWEMSNAWEFQNNAFPDTMFNMLRLQVKAMFKQPLTIISSHNKCMR